jgi:hypothetical protein
MIPSGAALSTNIKGHALELEAVFALDSETQQVGLRVLCSPDESEYTEIVYDREAKAIDAAAR